MEGGPGKPDPGGVKYRVIAKHITGETVIVAEYTSEKAARKRVTQECRKRNLNGWQFWKEKREGK